MTQKDVDRVMLVLYAMQEVGQSGSLEQMKAVCYCLRNRVRAGWGDWKSVLWSAGESSAHLPAEPVEIDINNRAYQRLLRDVDDIYFGHSGMSGSYGDAVSGAGGDLEDSLCAKDHECCYWAFLGMPMKDWFVETIVQDPQNHPNRVSMTSMLYFE